MMLSGKLDQQTSLNDTNNDKDSGHIHIPHIS